MNRAWATVFGVQQQQPVIGVSKIIFIIVNMATHLPQNGPKTIGAVEGQDADNGGVRCKFPTGNYYPAPIG
jgi:hypothetical protein